MINEVVPANPLHDFYGSSNADYVKTAISLFQKAGSEFFSIDDILQAGIYWRKRSIPTHLERHNPPTIIAKMGLKRA